MFHVSPRVQLGITNSKICIIPFKPGINMIRMSHGDHPMLRRRGISIKKIFRLLKIRPKTRSEFDAVSLPLPEVIGRNIAAHTPITKIKPTK
jgi:hypothetical protein